MNSFDHTIIVFVNQFARKSDFFDSLVNLFATNNMLKGGIMAMMFWLLWFYYPESNRVHVRQVLVATLFGALMAMFAARVLVHTLPSRTRPIYNKELHFVAPFSDWRTGEISSFADINSMPSDTATLVFALVMGVCLVHRRLGLLLLVYAAVFISLPRVYMGIHNPTDIIAGALLGSFCVYLTTRTAVLHRLFAPMLALSKQHPSLFYVGLFLVTSQISSMFDEFRGIMVFLFHTH